MNGSAAGFGSPVATTGQVLVVGARFDDSERGAAYVFTRTTTGWQQSAEVRSADGAAGDLFGASVAIVGKTMVVGAPDHGSEAGAVYVFNRAGGEWQQVAELSASDPSRFAGGFGTAVALQAEHGGWRLLVGAVGGLQPGAAFVYAGSGGSWTEQAELVAPDNGLDGFGTSVALSDDAAIVGAPYREGHHPGDEEGAAFLFSRSDGTWSAPDTIVPDDPAQYDQFGSSVALTHQTALVGSPHHGAGRAYVFTHGSGAWTQTGELAGSGSSLFGSSVVLDGKDAVVGAPGSASTPGSASVLARRSGTWGSTATLAAGDGAPGDGFGTSVAMADGVVAVGAADRGAAYVFTR